MQTSIFGEIMNRTLNTTIDTLERTVHPVTAAANTVALVVLGLMPLPVFVDVLSRLILGKSIHGAIEIEEFMLSIIVFFSVAYTHIHYGGHINIDLLKGKLPPTVQSIIDICLNLMAAVFFSLMSWQLLEQGIKKFADNEVSFSLGIPLGIFRFTAAIGAALLALMVLISFLKSLANVMEKRKTPWIIPGLVVAGLIVATPLAGWVSIEMSGATIGLLGMILLFVFLFLGLPIGYGMAVTGFLGMIVIYDGLGPSLSMIGISSYDTSASYMLTVAPLFILMGEFAYQAGISKDLFDTSYKWLGRMPGGLAMSSVAGCAGFSAVCGDSLATAVTMGTVALPSMKKHGYSPRLSTGCLAAGGTLGILIPPSVGFIFYAIVTEESIGKLFVAGLVPGLLMTAIFIAIIYVQARRNPEIAPRGDMFSWSAKFASLKGVIGMLLLFILILGGILGGIFSPVEGGAIGSVGTFIYALLRGRMTWPLFVTALKDTVQISCKLLLILIGVGILGYFLAATQLPFALADFVTGLEVNRYLVFISIIILFLLLGCLLNVIPMILLVLPTIFPSILALGFDPIWFGVVTVITMEMGQITPPIGVNVFAITGVAGDVPMQEVFRGIFPFFLGMLLTIFLLTLFPQIVTFLPNLLLG
jgi:tripartite ATP-independent transporter DctM subunit